MAISNQTPVEAMDLSSEKALGLVSFGLMQKLATEDQVEFPWLDGKANNNFDQLRNLRQRLELTALAIQTGAPLSTSEVTYLLGTKPLSEKFMRGGIVAKRLSRNVWNLRQANQEVNNSTISTENYRRRL